MNQGRLRKLQKKREEMDGGFERFCDLTIPAFDLIFRDSEEWDGGDSREIGAHEVAFGILVTGSIAAKAKEFLNWTGHIVPPHNQLNQALKDVGDEIIRMARASCEKALSKLKPGCVIGVDGSWEHRRNSHRCFIEVCDTDTGKVIGYIVMSNLLPESDPRYCRIPQNMEVEGLRLLLPGLMCHPEIVGYCHDNDAKTSKLIRLSGWGITESLDPGHAMKSFERILGKYSLLKEIAVSLRKFMKRLLHWSHVSVEQKQGAWINAYHHYNGDHGFCPFQHKENKRWIAMEQEQVQNELRSFLEESKWILKRCNTEFSTQTNESIHRLKLKYATKDIKWNSTWEARMACAVLDRNQPFWKFELYHKLGLSPLPPEALYQRILAERERITMNVRKSPANKHLRRKIINRLNLTVNKRLGKLGYRTNPFHPK
jgi:hypothetical protein